MSKSGATRPLLFPGTNFSGLGEIQFVLIITVPENQLPRIASSNRNQHKASTSLCVLRPYPFILNLPKFANGQYSNTFRPVTLPNLNPSPALKRCDQCDASLARKSLLSQIITRCLHLLPLPTFPKPHRTPLPNLVPIFWCRTMHSSIDSRTAVSAVQPTCLDLPRGTRFGLNRLGPSPTQPHVPRNPRRSGLSGPLALDCLPGSWEVLPSGWKPPSESTSCTHTLEKSVAASPTKAHRPRSCVHYILGYQGKGRRSLHVLCVDALGPHR